MKENILKMVAQPPRLFYAPFMLGVINILVHIVVLLSFVATFQGGKIVFVIISVVVFHAILVVVGKKEPHISGILKSFIKSPNGSKNIVKEKGCKYLP